MNQSLKTVLTLIITIAVIAVVAFGTSSIIKTNEINSKSAEFRTAFIEACNINGNQSSYCTCVYDDLEYEFGTKGMYDMAVKYDETGRMPSEAITSALRCIGKYNG